MLATENLKDDRAPDCAPSSSALASASAAFATSTISPGSDGDDDDCDDEPEEASSTPAPTSSKKNTAAKETAAASSSSSSKKADPTTSSKKAEASSSSSSSSKKAAAATTSSSSAKAAATASSSSGGGLAGLVAKIFSGGQATFFTQNGVAGACGQVHPDSAIIAALQTSQYANGAHCGKFIQVVNKKNNKSQKVQVADECPTCDGTTSVDFSKGAFDALGGTVEEGVFESKYNPSLAISKISDASLLQLSGVSLTTKSPLPSVSPLLSCIV